MKGHTYPFALKDCKQFDMNLVMPGFQKQRKSVSIRAATAIITVDIYLENYDNSSACRIVILTANIYGENYDALEL